MPEPVEETLLAGVVDLLKGMTGVRYWGGAYPNPPTIVRDPLAVTAIPKFPFLVASAFDGEYSLSESGKGLVSAGGAVGYENHFRIVISGFVHATDNVSADTWRLRLRKDVLETLAAPLSPVAGLPLRSIWPDGETSFDVGELGEGIRQFTQVYLATFDEVLTFS